MASGLLPLFSNRVRLAEPRPDPFRFKRTPMADYISTVSYRSLEGFEAGPGTTILALGLLGLAALYLTQTGPFGRKGFFGRRARAASLAPYQEYRAARETYRKSRRKNPRRRVRRGPWRVRDRRGRFLSRRSLYRHAMSLADRARLHRRRKSRLSRRRSR